MQDRRGAPPQPSDELGTGLLATARRVGHLAWFERRCFEWLGAWSTVPVDPPVTLLLGEAAARHGWHAEVLVARLPELREVDRGSLVVPPDGAAEAFLRAVTVDPDPGSVLDALVGQYRVLLPTLIGAYRRVLEGASPVADGSLARWVRMILDDDLDEWCRGDDLLRGLLRDEASVARAAERQRELESLLLGSPFPNI